MASLSKTDCIEKFLNSLSLNGLSENTIRAYRADLKMLSLEYPSTPMVQEQLEMAASLHLNKVRTTMAPTTVKRKLACFRKFGRFNGWPTFLEDYKPPRPAPAEPHPLNGGVDDILKMIAVSRKPEHTALAAFCGLLGLRVGEAIKVKPEDFDMRNNKLLIRGKGDKRRIIDVAEGVWQYLMPAFLKAEKNGTTLIPLHDRTARRAWTSMARRAGLGTSATHDGRMTFGTTMYYKSGGDIRAVQTHLGHASSITTEGYTKVNAENMRRAANLLGD